MHVKVKIYKKHKVLNYLFISVLLKYLYLRTELDRTYLRKNIKKNKVF